MITVIGAWEENWMDAERTERRLWKQTLQSYQVDNWFMTPPQYGEFTSPLQYKTVQEALDASTGKRIFLTPEATVNEYGLTTISLADYVHPEDAVYIFCNAISNNHSVIRDEDDVVTIFTPQKTDWFAPVAMGATLYDRFTKSS